MKNQAKKIDHLYKTYGYKIVENEHDYKVYMLQQGVYHGVDIIIFENSLDPSEIIKRYADAGYATKKRFFSKVEQIELELFKSFFSLESTQQRISNKIRNYKSTISKGIGVEYQYIDCDFDVLSGDNEETGNIIDYVSAKILKRGTKLIIIEAAAGYGKTSTAYQLLQEMITSEKELCPLFAELSRNRQAQIFKYVLLDEIDREYPALNSKIVMHEIKTGRIPLLIDGFDELLQKSNSAENNPEDFESVQAMLETIGSILEGEAKIILTSRSTAIFSGDDFFNWIIEKSSSFETTRILLHKPDTTKWLGYEKIKMLQANGVPIEHISNPVLLAFLRSLPDNEFDKCCLEAESIVNHFFQSLLTREQERQHLNMTPSEQLQLFERLARDFVSFGITAEDKEFVGELIFEGNQEELLNLRQRYDLTFKPSLEELVETLTNHVLLDRIGWGEEQIGFINQFVFGILIGNYAIKADDEWILNSFSKPDYIELSAFAYKVKSQNQKTHLYNKISLVDDTLDNQQKLVIDNLLTGHTVRKYNAASINELEFNNFIFTEKSTFYNCYFADCSFEHCAFNKTSFKGSLFINCKFSNCTILNNTPTLEQEDVIKFVNCSDYESRFIEHLLLNQVEIQNPYSQLKDYKVEVLQQFWPVGRPHAVNSRRLRTLYAGFKTSETEEVGDAIKYLCSTGLITVVASTAKLNNSKMNEIRSILKY